MAVFHEGFPD